MASRNAPRTPPQHRLDFASIWSPILEPFSCHEMPFSAPVSLVWSWPHLQPRKLIRWFIKGAAVMLRVHNVFWDTTFHRTSRPAKPLKLQQVLLENICLQFRASHFGIKNQQQNHFCFKYPSWTPFFLLGSLQNPMGAKIGPEIDQVAPKWHLFLSIVIASFQS